jgi:hypothetical protein
MRESLEKMLAKGVDNPLLRFGLGKAWLDEGNGAEAAVHLARCVSRIRSIRRRGSCWARPISCRVTWPAARKAWEDGIVAAQAHGDKQAEKEMTVFLKKLNKI